MLHTMNALNLIDSQECSVEFDDKSITECPQCHKSIVPNPIFACVYQSDFLPHASILFHCRDCASTFLAHYCLPCSISGYNHISYTNVEFLCIEPQRVTKQIFDISINELSPRFVSIYNQSFAADTYGLDEIAGIGYRKSLEFLVKDFAIYLYPEAENTIKAMPLSQCIRNYIDNQQIKTLVERSAWIGNDEAHYIRKQTGRDINDMKSFIKATVYFISMYLIAEDASSMDPK
ncbi:MAG: DUF4145 domain-containing protein [Lachnospiraceae bacterium]|nr:DUF4145 domain-containing protein [Lachnospiraceae bacterium]